MTTLVHGRIRKSIGGGGLGSLVHLIILIRQVLF